MDGQPLKIPALGPARAVWRRLLDALLPPACLRCGELVAEPGALCGACWEKVDFLGPPWCVCCGLPFELDPGVDSTCGACLAHPPAFDRARAVFAYDGGSRDIVLTLKHADRTDAVPGLVRWMARAGSELIADADVIVPVPLHWTRLWRRRYNQAALLAVELGKLCGRPVLPGGLVRARRTPSQAERSPEQRRRNVAGAFRPGRGMAARLEGKRVLLIDDVLTTGATVSACARVLKRHGAKAVDILTLARVTRPLT